MTSNNILKEAEMTTVFKSATGKNALRAKFPTCVLDSGPKRNNCETDHQEAPTESAFDFIPFPEEDEAPAKKRTVRILTPSPPSANGQPHLQKQGVSRF